MKWEREETLLTTLEHQVTQQTHVVIIGGGLLSGGSRAGTFREVGRNRGDRGIVCGLSTVSSGVRGTDLALKTNLTISCLVCLVVAGNILWFSTPWFIKSGPLCIFTITFQILIDLNENYITVFIRKFGFSRCGLQLHISSIFFVWRNIIAATKCSI